MNLDRRYNINEIIAIDMVIGNLAKEAEECYDNSLYAAANACLFLLSEHAIKYRVEELDGNFSNLLSKAKKIGIISEEDFLILDRLREIRNKLFHESNYMWALEIDDIVYQFSEPDTKRIIYEIYAGNCFAIIKRILSSEDIS
jgi:hypothetical protein